MREYLYKELYELENKHWWFVAKKNIVLSMLKKYLSKNNGKILDAGCGSGLMLNELNRLGTAYGMDSSTEAIKFSKLIFNGEIKQGSMPYNIPYPKNYFDAVLALDVIEHIVEDVEALKDMREHLSEEGVAVITVPAFMSLWSNHDVVHQHKRRYNLKELKEKLQDADYEILKISYYNTFLFIPILMIRKIHKLLKVESDSDAKMPNAFLNFILKKIFLFEKIFLHRFNMKFGVSIIAVVKK